jgi:peptide/nickel transport system permease protein
MLAYSIRRILLGLLGFFVLTYIIYFLTTKEGIAELFNFRPSDLLSLDYIVWLNNIIHGNFGTSMRDGTAVSDTLRTRLPVTLMLVIPAFILQEIIAFAVGIYAGLRYPSPASRILTGAMFWIASIPQYLAALIVVFVFGVELRWFPFGGTNNEAVSGILGSPQWWAYFHANLFGALGDLSAHLLPPVILLAVMNAASDSQIIRLAVTDALKEEYIRAATAHGIPRRKVIWKHIMGSVIGPLATNITAQLPNLVFMAMFIEFIFTLPGIGDLFVKAVDTFQDSPQTQSYGPPPADHTVITAYFLILAVVVVLSALLGDLIYAARDPRIRLTKASARGLVHLPFGLDRQLARIGNRSVTVGGALATGVVLVVGIVGGVSVQRVLATRPTVSGNWAGTITLTDNSGSTVTHRLTVSLSMKEAPHAPLAQGNVSGTAEVCGDTFSSGNAPLMYSLNGTTTVYTVSVALVSVVDNFSFSGQSSASSMYLRGYYEPPSGLFIQANMTLIKSTQPPGAFKC